LFRGIIPPLGGTLDFSPILAFVLLSVSAVQLASLAAA
jgi:YggT family protein